MLEKKSVVNGKMGKELAKFLIEFLPFEEQQKSIIESVNLVLQAGLINKEMCTELWKRGKRKNSYFIGFLQQIPNQLPIEVAAHKDCDAINNSLKQESQRDNKIATLLCQVLSSEGQAYLDTVEQVFEKPNDQEAVAALLNTVGDYFNEFEMEDRKWRDIRELIDFAEAEYASHPAVEKVLVIDKSLAPKLKALFKLSMISETLVDPIFGMTDAIGSVMRKKIEHVVGPITENLQLLR